MLSVCCVPGAPPRTFILQLIYFRDRDLVLMEAWKKDVIRHEAAKLMFFLDFSVDTQKLHKSFDSVKQTLHTKGVKYSMLFPTRLRVVDEETICFFPYLAC